MPWDVAKDERCPAARPWGVVKQDEAKTLEGCHESEDKAKRQQAALYASEESASAPIGGVMDTDTGATLADAHANEPPAATADSFSEELLRYQAPSAQPLFELRDDEAGMPTLVGHFAVFDSWTEINSTFEGQFMERIAPGAFSKTFAENASRMRVLFNHGKDVSIGEKVLGRIERLEEDEHGAYYEVPLYDRPYVHDLIPGLRDNQYGSSFRFRVVKEDFNRKPDRSEWNPEGLPERTIQEARVFEFGPVTFPAYGEATAGLRSATDWLVEHDLRHQLEAFAARAAALGGMTVTEASANFVDSSPEPASRRTRDFLRGPEKETKRWV